MAASQALRGRFEAGLKCYLAQQPGEFVLVDAFVDDAFKLIYDRSEQVKEFGELTLGEYIQLFFKEQCWNHYKGVMKREEAEVKHMLEGVRDTRNVLAHFREEQVTAQKRLQLKFCADWLSERERLIVEAVGEAPPVQ